MTLAPAHPALAAPRTDDGPVFTRPPDCPSQRMRSGPARGNADGSIIPTFSPAACNFRRGWLFFFRQFILQRRESRARSVVLQSHAWRGLRYGCRILRFTVSNQRRAKTLRLLEGHHSRTIENYRFLTELNHSQFKAQGWSQRQSPHRCAHRDHAEQTPRVLGSFCRKKNCARHHNQHSRELDQPSSPPDDTATPYPDSNTLRGHDLLARAASSEAIKFKGRARNASINEKAHARNVDGHHPRLLLVETWTISGYHAGLCFASKIRSHHSIVKKHPPPIRRRLRYGSRQDTPTPLTVPRPGTIMPWIPTYRWPGHQR